MVTTDATGSGLFDISGLTNLDATAATFTTATTTSPAGNTLVFPGPIKATSV
jgi:hypothetical protein